MISSVFVLASLSLFSQALALPTERFARADGAACCTALEAALPGLVSLPSSSNYAQEESEYFITQQRLMKPACRVSPKNAQDVSTIVKLALKNECKFAVRGGGHGHTVGESNIDASGFTIDMRDISNFSISDDGETASTGTGALWRDYFAFVESKGKSVPGGRMSEVGTGGFLLGGGVSVFSNQVGFASASVKNYEIVLANGTIANANEQENSDLFWALKFGSTAFGIVTRYDQQTIPVSKIYGGGITYPGVDNLPGILKFMNDFAVRSLDDDKGHSAIGVAGSPSGYAIWQLNTYSDAVNEFPSPLFDGVKFPNASDDTTALRTPSSIAEEVTVGNAGTIGRRTKYIAVVYKPDVQFEMDVFHKCTELLDPLLTVNNTVWSTGFQPISQAMIRHSLEHGGNPSGLDESSGELILSLLSIFWDNEEDDAAMLGALEEVHQWTLNTAEERGLDTPFIYMNYADGSQPVFASFGEENVAKLKSIQSKYDPGLKLQKYWKGGFDL